MPKGTNLTFFEREKIEVYLRMKKKKAWIARKLHRDYSVIKREIRRNSGEHTPYVAEKAQEYAERRKKKTNVRKLEKWQNEKLRTFVEAKLQEGWSPEQIAGRLKTNPPEELKDCKDKEVSYEAIYDWVYNGEGKYFGLYNYLRRKQKIRNSKKRRKKGKKMLIPDRVSIEERPFVSGVGHWETDSVIFVGKSILSVQFEKAMKLARLTKCPDKTAASSEEAVRKTVESLPRRFRKSMTRDNGTENVLHKDTKIPSYFCDPYASHQKGGVENLNSLIREYFPKRSNLDTITEEEIFAIQEKLNNRPRKSLNYVTPNEAFAREISKKGALNS